MLLFNTHNSKIRQTINNGLKMIPTAQLWFNHVARSYWTDRSSQTDDFL